MMSPSLMSPLCVMANERRLPAIVLLGGESGREGARRLIAGGGEYVGVLASWSPSSSSGSRISGMTNLGGSADLLGPGESGA